MDCNWLIEDLKAEKAKLERVITELEALQAETPFPKRRGRKFMGGDERHEVSERMKRYWANRRHVVAVS